MTLSTQQMRARLQTFDFKRLFVEALGWNTTTTPIPPVTVNGVRHTFAPIAEQGGMLVVTCTADDGNIPPTGARRKIDQHVTALAFEHLIIFLDRDRSGTAQTSLWWWVKREADDNGRTHSKPRTFTYRRGMQGDALLQKLAGIAFELSDLDDDGKVAIGTVTGRVQRAFDVEAVTRRFYDQFKAEHTAFLKFLTGLPDETGGGTPHRDWYASVMLNRLMFLYLIQKKRFLNHDPDYLRTKLAAMQQAGKNFYRDFLLTLFFEGLACEEGERSAATNALLGTIPYLNGGLFLPHPLETRHADTIAIADAAFERLFTFFDSYTWHLDERELRQGNEINPDVLGYIFEKYINQKQMGAYYTKEDITGYIGRSTILPFLLDKCGVAVKDLLPEIDPYLHDAVTTTEHLPTETEREYAARRARHAQIRADFAAGKITAIDDLVTYNLDLQTLTEDWLRGLTDPALLRRFYFDCLRPLTVLDPTAGSGAFLFAAINILEPLYELVLDKMRQFIGATEQAPAQPTPHEYAVEYRDFVTELRQVSQHPNRRYFVLKSIIVNNLYGVDIMDEAVEICKLRLFLKLAAQVDDPARVEPLPDIDFNIRAGNTLVGFATRAEIDPPADAGAGFRLYNPKQVLGRIETMEGTLRNFRAALLDRETTADALKKTKAKISTVMGELRDQLDAALMQDYGQTDLARFRATHKPFHWYAEFNTVLTHGGFDVIIGNPPYVEYSKVRKEYTIRGYKTESAGNLYAPVCERAFNLAQKKGRQGLIVPLSLVSTERMKPLQQQLMCSQSHVWLSNFDVYPTKLFDGAKQRLTIYITSGFTDKPSVYSTRYNRWKPEERNALFEILQFTQTSYDAQQSVIPKVGTVVNSTILRKLVTKDAAHFLNSGNEPSFYVHRIPYNYVKGFDFIPYFWNQVDGQKKSEDYKPYYLAEKSHVKPAIAVLNSTTFFWWWYTLFEGYHCGRHEIHSFPFGMDDMPQDIQSQLSSLTDKLMADYKRNAKRKAAQYKTTGKVEYDEFYPRLSKPIIDEIDRVLARHYGFTAEELDFILHYDLKYRLGRDAESAEEDAGDEA